MSNVKKMRNEKCKMTNAKCGGDLDQHFAFCIKHFALNISRRPRSGLSLTEVLIAMGILTLGLLGVASIFPVAGFYMHKADLEDRGAAIARSVMNDVVTRGMHNPRAWYVMTPPGVPASATSLNQNWQFPNIDGKYCPIRRAPQPPFSPIFSRPFAEALSEGIRITSDPVMLAKQFGSAYVIDPLYAAAVAPTPAPGLPPTVTPNTNANNRVGYAFPASALMAYASDGNYYYSHPAWNPWKSPTRAPQNPTQLTWPIRRVTFQQSTGWPIDSVTAAHYFQGSDDLSTELPDRDDRPAAQNWDTLTDASGAELPMVRQWGGDYSWIVSVVPATTAARNGMARNPESFSYDVSVVVFYKRVLPTVPPMLDPSNNNLQATVSQERSVGASIISTGLNGGELLLKDLDEIQESPFRHLRTGQWIMLCGPHPNSTIATAGGTAATGNPNIEPRFVLKWYQVLSVETEGLGITDPAKQRIVAVRGPQWPWQPEPNGNLQNYNYLSNDLCVGICRGAVAVHTKTIRMENVRGGSWGSGMAVVVPPGITPPVYSTY
jgi:hypothetical protein